MAGFAGAGRLAGLCDTVPGGGDGDGGGARCARRHACTVSACPAARRAAVGLRSGPPRLQRRRHARSPMLHRRLRRSPLPLSSHASSHVAGVEVQATSDLCPVARALSQPVQHDAHPAHRPHRPSRRASPVAFCLGGLIGSSAVRTPTRPPPRPLPRSRPPRGGPDPSGHQAEVGAAWLRATGKGRPPHCRSCAQLVRGPRRKARPGEEVATMPRPRKESAGEPKKRSRTGCWPCKARKVKCGGSSMPVSDRCLSR